MALIFLAAVSGGRIQQLRGTLDNIESRLLAEAIQGYPEKPIQRPLWSRAVDRAPPQEFAVQAILPPADTLRVDKQTASVSQLSSSKLDAVKTTYVDLLKEETKKRRRPRISAVPAVLFNAGAAFFCSVFYSFFWGLLFSSIFFLFWIEYQASKASELLACAKKACVAEITAEVVQKKYQDRLVHLSGATTIKFPQRDTEVGVVPNEDCVILKRTVEVLQWVEREKKSNQGESSYTYAKEWCETDVDSSRFQDASIIFSKSGSEMQSAQHHNPARIHRFYSSKIADEPVKMDAFELKENVLEKLTNYAHIDLQKAEISNRVFSPEGPRYLVSGGGNKVGDMRIQYEYVEGGEVSICGVQTENTIEAWHDYVHIDDFQPTPTHLAFPHTILLVEHGKLSKNEMFSNAFHLFQHRVSSRSRLIGRLVSLMTMVLAIYLICRPELLSFLPFVDRISTSMSVIVAVIAGLVLSMLTMSLAWALFRPEILFLTLAASGGLSFIDGTGTASKLLGRSNNPARAILIGQVSLGLACLPLVYFIYLSILELRHRWVIDAEIKRCEYAPKEPAI